MIQSSELYNLRHTVKTVCVFVALMLGSTLFSIEANAQRIAYNSQTGRHSRILESDVKKVTKFGNANQAYYMWVGLTSLEVKDIVLYSLKVMYTSEYRLSINKDDALVFVLKDGSEIVLKSKAHAGSLSLDAVETMFASYDISDEEIKRIVDVGVESVIANVRCFNLDKAEAKVGYKFSRMISLRYDMLKEYIEKNPRE